MPPTTRLTARTPQARLTKRNRSDIRPCRIAVIDIGRMSWLSLDAYRHVGSDGGETEGSGADREALPDLLRLNRSSEEWPDDEVGSQSIISSTGISASRLAPALSRAAAVCLRDKLRR